MARLFGSKNRAGKNVGETHFNHKLTCEDVRRIRDDKNVTLLALSKMYNVCPETIRKVRLRRTWQSIS
jgi:hypothetical protein